jgi:hypothetical protein
MHSKIGLQQIDLKGHEMRNAGQKKSPTFLWGFSEIKTITYFTLILSLWTEF